MEECGEGVGSCGCPTEFKNTFFQIAKLRFSTIYEKIPEFYKNSQGRSLKARGLIFWFLALYISILAPVKTECEKSLIPSGNLSGPRRPWQIGLRHL